MHAAVSNARNFLPIGPLSESQNDNLSFITTYLALIDVANSLIVEIKIVYISSNF